MTPQSRPAPRPAVTIRDVAEAAGVSLGTVSNALNRPDVLAPDTLGRVQTAIEELGFVRHAGAALLRGRRASAIGLILLDVSNPFFIELARGVENSSRQRQQLVFLCNTDENISRERHYLDALAEQRVPGVIISPIDPSSTSIDALRAKGIAVVLLGRLRDDYCSVQLDDTAGGRIAAQHLIDTGHRQLLYVSGPRTIQQYEERYQGAQDAIRDRAAPVSLAALEVGPEASMRDGAEVASALIHNPNAPTGILCGNDLIALGLMHSLLRSGNRIPEDFAIVGYDDIPSAAEGLVPLTTIRQPAREIGAEAARLLADEATDTYGHRHQQIIFTPELVVRASSAHSGG